MSGDLKLVFFGTAQLFRMWLIKLVRSCTKNGHPIRKCGVSSLGDEHSGQFEGTVDGA